MGVGVSVCGDEKVLELETIIVITMKVLNKMSLNRML